MIENMIGAIKEAEQKAKNTLSDAKIEANEIVSKAQTEASKIMKDALNEKARILKDAQARGEADSIRDYEAKKPERQKLLDRADADFKKKSSKAVEAVLREILG